MGQEGGSEGGSRQGAARGSGWIWHGGRQCGEGLELSSQTLPEPQGTNGRASCQLHRARLSWGLQDAAASPCDPPAPAAKTGPRLTL